MELFDFFEELLLLLTVTLLQWQAAVAVAGCSSSSIIGNWSLFQGRSWRDHRTQRIWYGNWSSTSMDVTLRDPVLARACSRVSRYWYLVVGPLRVAGFCQPTTGGGTKTLDGNVLPSIVRHFESMFHWHLVLPHIGTWIVPFSPIDTQLRLPTSFV